MYEERRDRFSLRDIILQVLFVALFVFILMWLFPTKNFVTDYTDKAIDAAVKEALDDYEFGGGINSDAFANQLFNQNVMMMKDGAKDYFTLSRLPEKNGDKVKLTLKQMLSEKIILPFIDSNGKSCDVDESYVLVTKTDTEYLMKVNLKCSDYEDYLLVHMGCYDYCSTTICENKTPSNPVKGEDSKPTPTPTPTPAIYEYEYKLVVDGKWGEFGEWSEWSENIISKTDYREVETKTEQVQIGTKTEQVQTGTKTEQVQTGTKTEQVQIGTKTEQIQTGTKTEQVQTGTRTEQVQTGTRTEQVQTGTRTVPVYGTKTVPVYETKVVPVYTTIRVPVYKNVNSTKLDCNNTCKYVTVTTQVKTGETTKTVQTGTRTEKIQTGTRTEQVQMGTRTVPVYETRTVPAYTTVTIPVYETKVVPVYETKTVPVYETKKVPVYETKVVPVYETKVVPVYETKVVPVYETKTLPVYKDVTYYRARTREYIDGSVDIKWSRSQNDVNLIKQGYTLTGNTREV